MVNNKAKIDAFPEAGPAKVAVEHPMEADGANKGGAVLRGKAVKTPK